MEAIEIQFSNIGDVLDFVRIIEKEDIRGELFREQYVIMHVQYWE